MQNFGLINETFKTVLADGILAKDGKSKRIFSRYVKALKENAILKTQYNIYNKLENKVCDDKIKSLEYIKESIALLKEFGSEKILKENAKLVNFLTKNGYKLINEDYKHKELHENIDKLVMVKKTSKTLDSLMESVYFINEHILNNNDIIFEGVNNKDFYSNSAVGHIVVEKFNDKYKDLNEAEKRVIKTLINKNGPDKHAMFDELIKECVELVNNNLVECSIEEKDKLLQVKDKLLRMSYDETNFVSEIIKIINLKNNLI